MSGRARDEAKKKRENAWIGHVPNRDLEGLAAACTRWTQLETKQLSSFLITRSTLWGSIFWTQWQLWQSPRSSYGFFVLKLGGSLTETVTGLTACAKTFNFGSQLLSYELVAEWYNLSPFQNTCSGNSELMNTVKCLNKNMFFWQWRRFHSAIEILVGLYVCIWKT